MFFSIITINYNDKSGLRRTIESVASQTYVDYEYIIIDGGSTDGSVDVIKEFASDIDCWVSEKDRGIYHAMNKGVLQAHGDYCLFLNSGDAFYDKSVLEHIAEKGLKEDIIVGKLVSFTNDYLLTLPQDLSPFIIFILEPFHIRVLLSRQTCLGNILMMSN